MSTLDKVRLILTGMCLPFMAFWFMYGGFAAYTEDEIIIGLFICGTTYGLWMSKILQKNK